MRDFGRGVAAAAVLLLVEGAAVAGVRPKIVPPNAAQTFDPAQSAALFVGVRAFTHDLTLHEVRFAVDDAIDLAFVFSIGSKVPLIEPKRVVLALSGDAQKPISQQHLDALIAAGATVKPAGHSDILTLLEQQSRAAGANGALIIAFATHGISFDGTQYLLTSTSLLRHRETTIAETKVRDIAAQSDAGRSLILLDACRQTLTWDTREGEPDPRSAAAFLRKIAGIHGQVVLSAAAAGEYAYDDETQRNGVFTAAVIAGLRCAAERDDRGYITVDTLAMYVEERVLTWVRKNRDPRARRATQLQYEGLSKTMPLALCDAH
jgi:hypothetical protein